jgi:hypothetical protein
MALYKEVYGKRVASLPNRKAWLYNRFKSSTEDFGGKYFTFPVHLSGGQSVGSVGDDQPLPGGGSGAVKQAQAENTVETRIYDKYHYATIMPTGPAIAHARKHPYAFVTLKGFETRNKTEWLVNYLNGACYRRGIEIARMLSISTNDITIRTKDQIRHFRPGQRVDFYDSAAWTTKHNDGGAAAASQGREVEAVDYATNTFTYSGSDLSGVLGAGDFIVREDTVDGGGDTNGPVPSDGVELTGLRAIVDDGTDSSVTFQNISRTTYPEWSAQVLGNSGTLREITLDLLQQAEDQGEIDSGKRADMLVTGYGQRRKYLALLLPDVRFAPQKLIGGFKTLQWNDKSVFIDKACNPEEVYMLVRRSIQKYNVQEIGILDNAGPAERIAGYDKYEIVIGGYFNLGVDAANCNVRLVDLKEP